MSEKNSETQPSYEQLEVRAAQLENQLRLAWMRVGELDALVTSKNQQIAQLTPKAEQNGGE